MDPRPRPRRRVATALCIALSMTLVACGGSAGGGSEGAGDDGRVSVVAALYPLAWVAASVGGERVDVVDLTPPGVEAHDATLSAVQRAEVLAADVMLVLGDFGFQPDIERAALDSSGAVVDVTQGLDLLTAEEHLAFDPHLWLDPVLMLDVVATVGAALAAADPGGADAYAAGEAATSAALRELDDAFVAGLAACAFRGFVTSHEAFTYLATRYGLSQVALEGPGEEAEPSAEAIERAIVSIGSGAVAPAIFADASDDARRIAEAIAQDVGTEVAVLELSTLESEPEGDYPSVMLANLEALVQGLSCER